MLDYIYSEQASQYAYYRIPKILFTDDRYRDISTDAKVLYGLLLDRVSLSIKNKWVDDQNRVFIIFSLADVQESLNCGPQKATALFRELEKKAGLIERKRQGLGKTNLIYVAEQAGDSSRNVQRFIRLTELIPELLDMVDQKQLSFNPAVELSYLSQPEQHELLDAMDYAQSIPSLSQAQRLKKLSQEGTLDLTTMRTIMSEIKKPELGNVTLKDATLRKYFPRSYTPRQMQETIIKLLEQWQKRRQRDMER